MTIQEAIKQIRKNIALISDLDCTEYEMAISALEKRIQKKPKKIKQKDDSFYRYYCPVCGRYFENDKKRDHTFLFKETYCQGDDCGQAIDWNEQESSLFGEE